jgi:hypothetical protein
MFRATFFAIGLFVTLSGAAFLYADRIVLVDNGEKLERDKSHGILNMVSNQQVEKDLRRVIDPPDWASFGLLSLGAVTILYSIALPRPYHHG